jgi:hypothetical protein
MAQIITDFFSRRESILIENIDGKVWFSRRELMSFNFQFSIGLRVLCLKGTNNILSQSCNCLKAQSETAKTLKNSAGGSNSLLVKIKKIKRLEERNLKSNSL